MVFVSATEFAKNFGLYKEKAQREPVAITSYNRTSGYFISAEEYESLQRAKARERRAYHLAELPRETVEAMKAARMDPVHDHLNALLDEA